MADNTSQRVAVFIDNSNVFHNLRDLRKVDTRWTSLYDPLELARRVTGGRNLVFVGFYCARPPSYLLDEGGESEKKHKTSMRYYSAVEKLPGVQVRYGSLQGAKGSMQEKNVDTQLTTDLIKMAALNEFDVAIIVSNDGDYASAAETARSTFGKRIEVAFFKGSFSMNLRRVADLSKRMRRDYFKPLLLGDESRTAA